MDWCPNKRNQQQTKQHKYVKYYETKVWKMDTTK